jgi:hypothetical protein
MGVMIDVCESLNEKRDEKIKLGRLKSGREVILK